MLGSFKILTSTCIPSQINQTANLEAIGFLRCQFEATEKQIGSLFGVFSFLILIGVVNNEAERRRESTIELDSFGVLDSARPIQVSVNEGLHSV